MSAPLNTANRLKHEAQERGETKLLEPVRQDIIARFRRHPIGDLDSSKTRVQRPRDLTQPPNVIIAPL
jgi:hypothetical protein